ncbi:hypothetical protein [Wenjunlia vitaminophila]|uniref:hypothetical protein n=1 Tax=Wenjunlia vitaminophila TaxID=76728 RepID=UPI00037FE44B|nr:hypothetical protein [Wenjunlia vitaminophila]
MQRIAEALTRVLAVAAVPVLLVGCSGSSDDSDSSEKSATPTVASSPSASLEPAKFTRLPNACKTLSKNTVKDLVPKTKDASGDAAKSPDANARASCSWNGLNGYQYRWLDVALQRSDTLPGVGSAEDQAKAAFRKLKKSTATVEGVRKGEQPTIRVADVGDESQLVSAEVVKDKENYRDVTVVARTSNVVLTVSYDGAGFEGEKPPSATTMERAALKAAKEVLAQIT